MRHVNHTSLTYTGMHGQLSWYRPDSREYLGISCPLSHFLFCILEGRVLHVLCVCCGDFKMPSVVSITVITWCNCFKDTVLIFFFFKLFCKARNTLDLHTDSHSLYTQPHWTLLNLFIEPLRTRWNTTHDLQWYIMIDIYQSRDDDRPHSLSEWGWWQTSLSIRVEMDSDRTLSIWVEMDRDITLSIWVEMDRDSTLILSGDG